MSEIFRSIVGLAFISLLAACATGGPTAVSRDTIIVYGGVGYLSSSAQPELVGIIQNDAGGGDGKRLTQAVREAVAGANLTNLTRENIAIDDEIFDQILFERGLSSGEIRSADLQRALEQDNILVLSMIGTVEMVSAETFTISGERYDKTNVVVTVTAMLSKPKSGQIIMFENGTSFTDAGSPNLNLDTVKTRRLIKTLYMQAANNALSGLGKRSARGLTLEQERGMVVAVVPLSQKLQPLISSRPVAFEAARSSCDLPSPCNEQSGNSCPQFIKAMEQAVTKSMTNQGAAMLPPWSWKDWDSTASSQVRRNIATLRISTNGGASSLNDQLELRLGLDEASTKIVAVIRDYRPNTPQVHEKSALRETMFQRVYEGDIELHRYTGLGQCDQLEKQPLDDDDRITAVLKFSELNENRQVDPPIQEARALAIATFISGLNSR